MTPNQFKQWHGPYGGKIEDLIEKKKLNIFKNIPRQYSRQNYLFLSTDSVVGLVRKDGIWSKSSLLDPSYKTSILIVMTG